MMMRAPESTGFSTRVSSWNINLNLAPHFAYLMGGREKGILLN